MLRRLYDNNYLLFLLILLLLGTCTIWLMSNNYVNEYSLSRWSKVLAILSAPQIRLEHFGLVYPHFPIYVLMPFYYLPQMDTGAAPYLASTLIGVGLLMLWNAHLRAKRYSPASRFVLIVLVAFHPCFLWAVTSNTQHALSLVMFYLLYLSVARLVKEQDVRSFLMLGLVLAIYFFVDDRTFYMFIALLPLFPLVAPKKMLNESVVSVYLIIATPLLISVAAWVYLNWIFFADPWLFITSADSTFRGVWLDTPHIDWLRNYGGQIVMPTLIMFVASICAYPVLVWLGYRARNHRLLLRVSLVLLLHPILAGGLATMNYYLPHPISMVFLYSAGIMASLVLLPRVPRGARPTLLLLLLFSVLGGWATFAFQPTVEMQKWLHALQGQRTDGVYAADLSLGKWLAQHRQPTLIDDHIGYRVIVARGDANGLILPYSQEYKIALRKQYPEVAQIVIANPSSATGARDTLNLRYPALYQQGMPGYELRYDVEPWRVYRKQHRYNATVTNE